MVPGWQQPLLACMGSSQRFLALAITATTAGLSLWSWEWQPLGLGLPGPVSCMVLVALGYRDKWGPRVTTEMVAGGAHCLWEDAVINRVCRGGICVLEHSERSSLWLLSEVEVWELSVYFALTLQKGEKSHQRTKTFREQKPQKPVSTDPSPLIGGRATLPKQD